MENLLRDLMKELNESSRGTSTAQAQVNFHDGNQIPPCDASSSSQTNLSNVRLRYEADGREQHDFAAVAAAAPPPPPSLPGINCRRILSKMRPGANCHVNNIAPPSVSNGLMGLNNASALSVAETSDCYHNFPTQEPHDSSTDHQSNPSDHCSNHFDSDNMLDSVLRSMQSTQDNLSDLIRSSATGNNVMHLLLLQNQQMIQQQQLMLMLALSERNNCCRHSHAHRPPRATSSATAQSSEYGIAFPIYTPLNNQGTPGSRPNNYYDNFRSNTRQNQLGTHPVPSSHVSGPNYSLDPRTQQPATALPHSHSVADNNDSTSRNNVIKRSDDRYAAVSIEQMMQKLNDRKAKTTNLETGHGNSFANPSNPLDQFTTSANALSSSVSTSASSEGSTSGNAYDSLPVLESTSGAIRKKPREPTVKSADRPSTIGVFKETNRSAGYSNETSGSSNTVATSNGNLDSLAETRTCVSTGQLNSSVTVSPSVLTHLSPNCGPSICSAAGASAAVAPDAIVSDEDEVDDEDTDDIRLSGDGEQGL